MEQSDRDRLNALPGRVIGCAFSVLNTLGAGFLEKVYENALAHELREAGLHFSQQRGVKVEYKGVVVGDYCVDMMIEDCLPVELKAVKALDESHQRQCVNYLKATNLHLGLLLNFGQPRLQIKRLVHRL